MSTATEQAQAHQDRMATEQRRLNGILVDNLTQLNHEESEGLKKVLNMLDESGWIDEMEVVYGIINRLDYAVNRWKPTQPV